MPVLLAKLWSVIPRLYAWPPMRHARRRRSSGRRSRCWWASARLRARHGRGEHAVLVPLRLQLRGRALLRRGRLRRVARRARGRQGAGGGARLPRARRAAAPARRPRPHRLRAGGGLVAPTLPAAPTVSRRGLLGRRWGSARSSSRSPTPVSRSAGRCGALALLAPRGRRDGPGPNDFQVNKTASGAGVTAAMTGAAGGCSCGPDGARCACRAPTCSPCRSARRRCRSPASRAGRPPGAGRGVPLAALAAAGGRGAAQRACSSSRCSRGGPLRQASP